MSADTYTAVPNPDRIKAKLTAKFCSLGQFGVHQVDAFHKVEDKPSEYAPCRGLVHRLRPDSLLFGDDVVRKLVNESCGVFLNLQAVRKQDEPRDLSAEVLKICRQYRCVARACVMELQEVAEDARTDEARREVCLQNRTIFYGIELIFHLCEILCLDVAPGSILLPKLLDWLCYHFPIGKQAQRVLDSQTPGVPLECHPEYWGAVKGLVLRGRGIEACEMLNRHSKAHSSPAIIALHKLLSSMPYIEEQGGTSVIVAFTLKWTTWQKEMQTQLESGVFSNNPQLQQIAELLAGNEKALEVIHEQSETWYQFLVSYLLFWEPTVQTFQLGEHANKCKRWFGTTEDRALDRIVMALFESDLLQVVKDLQEYSESGWAAVHLSDLLYHSGRLSSLDTHDHKVAEGLREDLLLQYGSLLASHRSLWQLGLSYLDHCPHQGRAQVELILPSIPQCSETKTLTVIYEAEKRNMKNVASSLCSVQGRSALRDHRLGAALTWALRARDVSLCSNVADAVLRVYALGGDFLETDLLDSLGTAMLTSDKLAFLGKYRQFHLNHRDERFKEAGVILMDLATSGYAPSFFLPVLLTDALSLMAREETVFSAAEIYRLLAALEELKSAEETLSPQDREDTAHTFGGNEQYARLCLAKKLATMELLEISAK